MVCLGSGPVNWMSEFMVGEWRDETAKVSDVVVFRCLVFVECVSGVICYEILNGWQP